MVTVLVVCSARAMMTMRTNGPSAAATAAAAVAGVLARPPRRATPETLSLDSVATLAQRPAVTSSETVRTNSAGAAATTLVRTPRCTANIVTLHSTKFHKINFLIRRGLDSDLKFICESFIKPINLSKTFSCPFRTWKRRLSCRRRTDQRGSTPCCIHPSCCSLHKRERSV